MRCSSLLIAALAVATVIPSAGATPLFNVNFENLPLNTTLPSSPPVAGAVADRPSLVVEPSSVVLDTRQSAGYQIFGPIGNKYATLFGQYTLAYRLEFIGNAADVATTGGATVSFDGLAVDGGGGNMYVNLVNAASQVIFRLQLNNAGTAMAVPYTAPNVAGVPVPIATAPDLRNPFSVRLDLDLSAGTPSVKTIFNGAATPQNTTLLPAGSSFLGVTFTDSYNDYARFYVDNFVVSPEPATGLLCVLAAVLLRRRQRQA